MSVQYSQRTYTNNAVPKVTGKYWRWQDNASVPGWNYLMGPTHAFQSYSTIEFQSQTPTMCSLKMVPVYSCITMQWQYNFDIWHQNVHCDRSLISNKFHASNFHSVMKPNCCRKGNQVEKCTRNHSWFAKSAYRNACITRCILYSATTYLYIANLTRCSFRLATWQHLMTPSCHCLFLQTDPGSQMSTRYRSCRTKSMWLCSAVYKKTEHRKRN